jgi:hypothetical protein
MKPRTALPVALLVSALLSACGGGGSGPDASATGTGTDQAAARSAALAAEAKRLIPIARQSQAVESVKKSLRIANAQSRLLVIGSKDPAAIAPLVAALEKPDYDQIIDIYGFYIQLGKPGTERYLIGALNSRGFSQETTPMALAFLTSGNGRLVRGVHEWARRNGLTITGRPPGPGPKWGSIGLAPAPAP